MMYGKSIRTANDMLNPTSVDKIWKTIVSPKEELRSKVAQLRTLLTIDEKGYRSLKTTLPYFVCGMFKPQHRRIENFASITCFVIDIDHLSEQNIDMQTIKERLVTDDRVAMLFVSPSGDGLKLLFGLKEKCFDAAKFSMFYKLFAANFGSQYGIRQVIDNRTSDVTRACFFSHDADAYFNHEAVAIDMGAVIDFEQHSQVREAELFIKETTEKQRAAHMNEGWGEKPEPRIRQDLPDDIYQQIRKKLNPSAKVKKDKQIFVPEELNSVEEQIKQKATELGITLTAMEDIHYGKKLKFDLRGDYAEVNLFFGKRGFTLVKSPKRGSNTELLDVAYRMLCEVFYE